MNYFLLGEVLLLCVVLTAGWITFVQQRRTRKIMQRLYQMLEEAEAGTFEEVRFDESYLSQIETKMAEYLNQCIVSSRNISEERDKIKSMIADISHQTKLPIANIVLYSELLSERELPQEAMECAEALKEQAEKLNFLIKALVKISRLETGIIKVVPEKNQIQKLFESVGRQIASAAEQKDIRIIFDETEVSACFDLKWTGEALYNVVDNAVKYSPVNSEIRVSVQSYELFCCITVTDQGIGIAEEEIPKVFGRFYRSKEVREKEGVGIGLYLAREIIAEESGYMKLSSRHGRGSAFSIFLPQGEEQTQEICEN